LAGGPFYGIPAVFPSSGHRARHLRSSLSGNLMPGTNVPGLLGSLVAY